MYRQLTKLLSNVVTYTEYIVKEPVVFEYVKEIAMSNKEGGKVRLKVDGIFVESSV